MVAMSAAVGEMAGEMAGVVPAAGEGEMAGEMAGVVPAAGEMAGEMAAKAGEMAARAGGVAEPMLSMRWPQLAACRSPQLRWATVLGCPHEISVGRIDCLWLSLCG